MLIEARVQKVSAWEVLDSRATPAVAVGALLSDGSAALAKVPGGASPSRHEACDLRDGDPTRFGGKGVLRAIDNVNRIIGPAIRDMNAGDQAAIDRRMIELDGTPDKSRLGTNAILGVSCAVARAAATSARQALWQFLAGKRRASLPLPLVHIISRWQQAAWSFDFADFLIVPHGAPGFEAAIAMAVGVHSAARTVLEGHGYTLTGVTSLGAWGPHLEREERALDILMESIIRAGYTPGTQISIAVDASASTFQRLDYGVEFLSRLVEQYPIVSIEDGLGADDWDGWARLTAALGNKVQLIGDDLFATNPARLEEGIARGAGNAVLVKMNQIGTLTETFAVIDRARQAGYRVVIAARAGETEDDFLADLAVASGAGQIKVGSVQGSERMAKYNRLLWIEQHFGLPWETAITPLPR